MKIRSFQAKMIFLIKNIIKKKKYCYDKLHQLSFDDSNHCIVMIFEIH